MGFSMSDIFRRQLAKKDFYVALQRERSSLALKRKRQKAIEDQKQPYVSDDDRDDVPMFLRRQA